MVMTWTKSGDKKAICNVIPRRGSRYFLKKLCFLRIQIHKIIMHTKLKYIIQKEKENLTK